MDFIFTLSFERFLHFLRVQREPKLHVLTSDDILSDWLKRQSSSPMIKANGNRPSLYLRYGSLPISDTPNIARLQFRCTELGWKSFRSHRWLMRDSSVN